MRISAKDAIQAVAGCMPLRAKWIFPRLIRLRGWHQRDIQGLQMKRRQKCGFKPPRVIGRQWRVCVAIDAQSQGVEWPVLRVPRGGKLRYHRQLFIGEIAGEQHHLLARRAKGLQSSQSLPQDAKYLGPSGHHHQSRIARRDRARAPPQRRIDHPARDLCRV